MGTDSTDIYLELRSNSSAIWRSTGEIWRNIRRRGEVELMRNRLLAPSITDSPAAACSLCALGAVATECSWSDTRFSRLIDASAVACNARLVVSYLDRCLATEFS